MYLCICICVFVYLCMRHLVISVLISLDQELSENVWFVWSKTSYSGDKWRCHRCGTDGRTDGRRTREDNATQPLDDGRLSFAITLAIVKGRRTSSIIYHRYSVAQNLQQHHQIYCQVEFKMLFSLPRCVVGE